MAFQILEGVLERKKEALPSNHPSIASTMKDIGIVQDKLATDESALTYFKKALKIYEAILPPDHVDSADIHIKIGYVRRNRQNYSAALEQF